jgi:sugar/nucleoside kinase (ribokinase family)
MSYDVLALGDYFLDLIFTELEGEPGLSREVFSKDFFMLPGGLYNTAATLHRLKVKVAWAANFGNDEFSQYVKNKALHEGLDPVCFLSENHPYRKITVSASFKGDREFISYSDPDRINLEYIRKVLDVSCRVLFIGGLYSGALLRLAKRYFGKQGTVLIMDGNSSHGTLKDKKIASSLKLVDIFMPNACEARRLTGRQDMEDCLRQLADLTNLVVIKDGSNGSYAIQNGRIRHVAGIPIDKCLDTTGAGDCFDAGFIKAWLDGLELEECLKWGNIVGGFSTRGFGGCGYPIALADVQKALKKYYRIK